jgi:glycerol-1-phosphate dehydrogenase [NAD(P)+]
MTSADAAEGQLLDAALRAARDTRLLVLDRGALRQTGEAFESLFGSASALVIADDRTLAAGRDVIDSLRARRQLTDEPYILDANTLYADDAHVELIRSRLAATDAIPIAVGSGTINDLVKLAAHQCGRPYLVAATAASMDGYTAYGASITADGSKQTFDCPAPRGVVADLDVIAAAPAGLNASGYADLAAKMPAGSDWIIADFLGEEPLNRQAWNAVQNHLRHWMADPAGVREGDVESLRRVTIALMMTGFAMQTARTSRCASGAEHQFSHLWDMQHHTHKGYAPSHGFKVGIGSLASIALYEALDELRQIDFDVERAVKSWPDHAANDREINSLFPEDKLKEIAARESAAKLASPDILRQQLARLKEAWPELSRRIHNQLFPHAEFKDMLREAGAPVEPEHIGIGTDRLRRSYLQAYHIRRRFTVLDLARRTSLLEPALERIFATSPSLEGRG